MREPTLTARNYSSRLLVRNGVGSGHVMDITVTNGVTHIVDQTKRVRQAELFSIICDLPETVLDVPIMGVQTVHFIEPIETVRITRTVHRITDVSVCRTTKLPILETSNTNRVFSI